MEKLDKKIIELNNQKYLVYLKQVPVRGTKEIIRAFVKGYGRGKKHDKEK